VLDLVAKAGRHDVGRTVGADSRKARESGVSAALVRYSSSARVKWLIGSSFAEALTVCTGAKTTIQHVPAVRHAPCRSPHR
jgi:hypothetical protein